MAHGFVARALFVEQVVPRAVFLNVGDFGEGAGREHGQGGKEFSVAEEHGANIECLRFFIFAFMAFFTKSNLEDLRREADQLSICIEHFLYASEIVPESDWKTKGFYDNCIEKCNGRMKAIHFLMESIRRGRPVTEAELSESREIDGGEASPKNKKGGADGK